MLKTQDYIRDGAAIYERSFAIIRAEADLSRFSAEEAEIAVRMIHACGQVSVAEFIEFAPGLVAAARGALIRGAPILCDAEMVAHGVTRARLPAKNAVVCTLRDPAVPDLGRQARHHALRRRARAVARPAGGGGGRHRQRADRSVPPARDAGRGRAAALPPFSACRSGSSARPKSKEALAANSFGVPYLIVRGRMGGSAMTAAAVNALGEGGDMSARLLGIGVGPGDPGLVTLKAIAALQAADVVAHFAKAGNASNARAIAACHFKRRRRGAAAALSGDDGDPEAGRRLSRGAARFLRRRGRGDRGAARPRQHRRRDRRGRSAVLRLLHASACAAQRRAIPTEIVAGVTGMSGCWSAVGTPIAQGDDVFTVLPGTLPEYELERRLADTDAAVVMKIGRHLAKVRRALDRAGRLDRAIYVERGTMANASVMPLADKLDTFAPYFAMVLVPGWEGRP